MMRDATWPEQGLGDLLKLEYGVALPATARSGVGFAVFGSNGEVGRHLAPLLCGPGVVVGRKGSAGEVTWAEDAFWPIDTTYYVVSKGLDLRWLYWTLLRLPLGRLDSSTGVPGLNRNDAYRLRVPRPPSPEQRQIAAILDTVDDAIRKTEQIIAKLKQVKQGLLHDLLTRGIDDNGELRDPERHPEQFKDSALGRIPTEWKVDRLERLTTLIVDGVHHTPTYVEQGVPFFTVQNLTKGPGISLEPRRYVSKRAHEEYRKRADPGAGDVLVSKDGTLGVARVVPQGLPEFSVFVSVAVLRPATGVIKSELIKEFFETASYVRQLGCQSAGTGLKHIHLEHFRRFLLVVPRMEEQERIVATLHSCTVRLHGEQSGLSKLRLLKQALMDDLLTGRVRTTPLLEGAPP